MSNLLISGDVVRCVVPNSVPKGIDYAEMLLVKLILYAPGTFEILRSHGPEEDDVVLASIMSRIISGITMLKIPSTCPFMDAIAEVSKYNGVVLVPLPDAKQWPATREAAEHVLKNYLFWEFEPVGKFESDGDHVMVFRKLDSVPRPPEGISLN